NRIWAATQSGVVALRKASGHWVMDAALSSPEGTGERWSDVEATSVGQDAGERLWISLVTGHVVSGLPTQKGSSIELTDIKAFGEEQGISAGFAEVIALEDGIRVGTATAVLKPQGLSLIPDPSFTEALGRDRGAFR